ncbi:MAG: hypothetical protein JW800_04450 [Candidatus Omnitrophica bacterium]|nr:hypothetical protein [Candidatus Omnitrophota bacterium]
MILKTIKSVLGILLLPVVFAVASSFYEQFGFIDINFTKGQIYFLWGVTAYCLFQLILIKPVYLYVLGHETVHVLATWLCLGRVTRFHVTSRGGSVSTTKTNIFIKLSPYFIPIYAILITAAYFFIIKMFLWGFLVRPYYMFLFGATLSFHIIMTIDTIKVKQPDFAKAGHIMSLVLIFVINMIIIAGILGLFFNSFSFLSFLRSSYYSSVDLYRTIFIRLFQYK